LRHVRLTLSDRRIPYFSGGRFAQGGSIFPPPRFPRESLFFFPNAVRVGVAGRCNLPLSLALLSPPALFFFTGVRRVGEEGRFFFFFSPEPLPLSFGPSPVPRCPTPWASSSPGMYVPFPSSVFSPFLLHPLLKKKKWLHPFLSIVVLFPPLAFCAHEDRNTIPGALNLSNGAPNLKPLSSGHAFMARSKEGRFYSPSPFTPLEKHNVFLTLGCQPETQKVRSEIPQTFRVQIATPGPCMIVELGSIRSGMCASAATFFFFLFSGRRCN